MEIAYFAMLSLFLTHELDAVSHREWRILPGLSALDDRMGRSVFIWAHVPLFAALFALGGANPQSSGAIALSAFAVIHVGLHWLLRNHPEYGFDNMTSRVLIWGAGMFGAVHLAFAMA